MDSIQATSADPPATVAVPHLPLHLAGRGRERYTLLRRRLARADAAAAALAGLAVGSVFGIAPLGSLLLAAGLALAWPATTVAFGLSSGDDLRTWASGVAETPRLALSAWLLSWPLYGVLLALGADSAVLGAFIATFLLGVFACLSRAFARATVHRLPELRQRTLIVGSGVVAQRVAERLQQHVEVGLDVIGFVDDDAHHPAMTETPRLGRFDALPTLIRDGVVDRVVIAFTRASHEELLACIRICRDAGVTVDIVPRLFDFLDGAKILDQVGSLPLLSIDAPRFSRGAEVAKRTLDIAGSALGLIMLAPVLAIVAAAIKLDSRGPVLFVQVRPGRRGMPFHVLKFRTMTAGASVEVAADGSLLKHADDARVTRVGATLRRFSIDEAPQLFNVLRGDMSLVGPRPLVTEESELLGGWQARRSDLRPGLTGPWQIAGRSHIPLEERLAIDYQYVAGWSLARDLEILLATFPAVLSGRGAY